MQEQPSRKDVWKMFDQISKTYDQTNRVISLGLDTRWRKKAAMHLPKKNKLDLLDLAAGTGDQIFSIFEAHPNKEFSAIGIDLSKEMLRIAQEKLSRKNYKNQISFQEGDAQNIPFPQEKFDVVTMSFGIRNVMDLSQSFQEMHRVLKKDGRALILEFSLPKFPVRPFHLFYLRRILPLIGQRMSKHQSAYRYLNETIETFPCGKAFSSLMKEAGFSKVDIHSLTLGTVNLYVAYKH
ncbi:MAG: bifunctional demethylmenaquinone methyltransferase/2-methoxy-6-polyprenyl-1,4-benzoquinol methylase UbiE [Simkaniaceae bacterium]